MPLEWINNPATYQQEFLLPGGSRARVTVECSPHQDVVIRVEFEPRANGKGVSVQVYFVQSNGRKFQASRKVEFFDDDRVVGYGDTVDGVRFRRHRHEIERALEFDVSVTSFEY